MTRRAAMLGLAALANPAALAGAMTEDDLSAIEAQHGGRLGVFALDTATGRTLAHRADERFLMCSTFKALLAAAVLSRVDAGEDDLGRIVRYTTRDLIFTSPVTKANAMRGAMTVGDLCRAAVEVSDNTAAILLMRRIGGPQALTRFARGIGDPATRSDRYEPASNSPEGERDTTTPRAMTNALRAILLGTALTPDSRGRMEGWMQASTPGRRRLRAALPASWLAGDRPGTSVDRETNDCLIVRPPGRSPLLVACYYEAAGLDMPKREAVLREAGGAFVRWAG